MKGRLSYAHVFSALPSNTFGHRSGDSGCSKVPRIGIRGEPRRLLPSPTTTVRTVPYTAVREVTLKRASDFKLIRTRSLGVRAHSPPKSDSMSSPPAPPCRLPPSGCEGRSPVSNGCFTPIGRFRGSCSTWALLFVFRSFSLVPVRPICWFRLSGMECLLAVAADMAHYCPLLDFWALRSDRLNGGPSVAEAGGGHRAALLGKAQSPSCTSRGSTLRNPCWIGLRGKWARSSDAAPLYPMFVHRPARLLYASSDPRSRRRPLRCRSTFHLLSGW